MVVDWLTRDMPLLFSINWTVSVPGWDTVDQSCPPLKVKRKLYYCTYSIAVNSGIVSTLLFFTTHCAHPTQTSGARKQRHKGFKGTAGRYYAHMAVLSEIDRNGLETVVEVRYFREHKSW